MGWRNSKRIKQRWSNSGRRLGGPLSASVIRRMRSRSINPQNNRVLNRTKMHFWSKFGDSNLNEWKVIVRTSSKWGKIRLLSYIWPCRSRSITPKNNRHLNQGVLRLSSKCGDSSVNGWWVIVRTSIDTHTQTHGQTHRRRRWQYPKAKTGLG